MVRHPSFSPDAAPIDEPDQFMYVKQTSTAERDAMIANFKKILADFDTDGDGRLSRGEAPIRLKAQFDRYDGFISLVDAEGWD